MISKLKTCCPWWAKFGLKLFLSTLPVPYRWWKQLGLFQHSSGDDVEYPERMFLKAFAPMRDRRDFVCLELGPGDRLGTALVACRHGAARTILVDVGRFASPDMTYYERLASRCPGVDFDLRSLESMLASSRATYLTDGVASLRGLPAASVDLIMSSVVLEHVRLEEFDELLRELRRVLRPEGVVFHAVDLQDHLGGGLNHLRFSAGFWESRWVASGGFYTNRIRSKAMCERFRAAGFEIADVAEERWRSLPISRRNLHPAYQNLTDDDLLVKVFEVQLRPAPAARPAERAATTA